MLPYYELPQYVPTAGGNSGTQFDFGNIPPQIGDEYLYARRLIVTVRGDFTSTADTVIPEGALLGLVDRFQLDIPDVGTTHKLTGIDVHRQYRFRHGHIPTVSPAAVASTSTLTRDWQYILEFVHPQDLKRNNGAMPIATLHRADFKAYIKAVASITGLSSFANATMIVGVECVTLGEKRIPTLYLQDYEQPAVNSEINLQPGWYTEAMIVPRDDATWTAPAGDYQTIEAKFGETQVWPSGTSQRRIVNAWDSWIHDQQAQAAGVGRLAPPMDTQGTVHDFVPLHWHHGLNADGELGHFFSHENEATRAKPFIKFNATPTLAAKVVRTRIADQGSWQDAIARDLQIPASNRKAPKLASKKGTGDVSVAARAPVKDYGPQE